MIGGSEAHRGLAQRLEAGEALFGIFSGDHTPEQGATMAGNRDIDFVFYSLETGPFDLPGFEAYAAALAGAWQGGAPPAFALRIPPVGDDPAGARDRIARAIAAGAGAIVVPHVHSAAQAAAVVEAMGPGGWPANPAGRLVNMLIVEDREGIAHVEEIVRTSGVSVVFAGPGDLRRAYDGDMDAVENAIQTVLASCLAAEVPCGITAGVDDIGDRLAEGFRVIIVTDPAAVAVGRRVAGRSDEDEGAPGGDPGSPR